MKIKNKENVFLKCFCLLAIVVYYVSLVYLYRKQAGFGISNLKYNSDLLAHINTACNGNACYSIIYLILGLLWKLPYRCLLIGILLAFFTLLSIYATFLLLRFLLPKISKVKVFLGALICNMYAPLFIPYFNDHRYLGLPGFILYHNSTYIAMRPFAIFSIIMFLKLRYKYATEKTSLKEWLIFSILMFITTWFKPNFMFGFAPCMLIIMIVDFIKRHGKNIFNYLILGSTVFPSILLMLWQQTQLFDGRSQVLGFSFMKVWGHYARTPLMAIIQSIAFPLLILIFNHKDLIKDKVFGFGWLFVTINILIHENNIRCLDGNLGWGANFAVGILFIISIYKFISTIHEKNLLHTVVAAGILGMHGLCWLNYYLMVVLLGNWRG